jgi:hypothetical protein
MYFSSSASLLLELQLWLLQVAGWAVFCVHFCLQSVGCSRVVPAGVRIGDGDVVLASVSVSTGGVVTLCFTVGDGGIVPVCLWVGAGQDHTGVILVGSADFILTAILGYVRQKPSNNARIRFLCFSFGCWCSQWEHDAVIGRWRCNRYCMVGWSN